jgi:uncharacterized coiled-coil protein SlyX
MLDPLCRLANQEHLIDQLNKDQEIWAIQEVAEIVAEADLDLDN